ncbi:hypothetical protein ID866_9423 [Astraeus odoratus]|nr:hypothetical protein ID866_9423 [Astraeus odoratus]
MNYAPITSTSPASHYWGIDQDVTYGESAAILNGSAGTVDTGTTLLATGVPEGHWRNFGPTTFEFTRARALNSIPGGDPNKIYLITPDLRSPSGSGLDFINGFGWLQCFYSVYDMANTHVSIATIPFTDTTTKYELAC